jgi:hypothetical protein
MSLKVLPEEEIFKNKYPDFKLFGFLPWTYKKKMVKHLQWVRAQNLNAD